jgi:putative cardiolipin synthase
MAQVRDRWARRRDSPEAVDYLAAVRDLPFVSQVVAGTVPLEWVPGRVVSDDPAKVLNPPERKDLQMLPKLERALGQPARELLLVSPYFVPTKDGTAALVAIAQRGVKVRVLTNSLAATDVSPVYAGYSKYRQELLRGGRAAVRAQGQAAREGPRRAGASTTASAAAWAAARARRCTRRPSRWTAAASSSARSTWTRARSGSIPRWASCWTA